MNLLIAIIDGIVGFIRRNPLFCLLIFLLALFAPSVLGGIAMFVLYALLGLVVLAIILLLSFRWRIYRMRKDLEDQFGGQSFGPGGSGGPAGNAREGEIHIRKTKGAGEKRVRKDVGDYIDFYLADGTVLPCVIGDIKSEGDANWTRFGHATGSNGLSVVEFVVDKQSWYGSGHANPGTASCHPEWAQQIVSATRVGSFDGAETQTIGGLTSCASTIVHARLT